MSIIHHHISNDWEYYHAVFRCCLQYSLKCIRYVTYQPKKKLRKNIIKPPYAHIVQIGDPVLRSNAEPVPLDDLHTDETAKIITLMLQCMRRYGCEGIAAPQIGVPLRIIVMEFTEKTISCFSEDEIEDRKLSVLPLTVFINPEMQITSKNKNEFSEGCMSLCGYAAIVPRYDSCTIRGIGLMGTPKTVKLTGWNARVAQHQMDHLDGKFFIDRMHTSTFICLMWKQIKMIPGNSKLIFNEAVC